MNAAKRFVIAQTCVSLFCCASPAVAQVKIDSAVFGNLSARCIGPAVMGGRICAIDAVRDDRLTIYVASASGCLWKSVNGGTTFKPVFDEHVQSIGAVTIDPSNPKVVWVGTGEPWTRNSVSVGDGVYRTADGGETWRNVGLKDTERIVKILIDPKNSDTVYVAALGHLWNGNEERGVFKTTDSGVTWKKVLYVDEDTGCGDLAMDPQDPRILYAGMWQFRRWPYFFKSGGPGSGLYKTTDGGETWREITTGLPPGELGRIAVAVAPSRPSVVYAVVEAEKTGLYRSDDLGESWRWMGTNMDVEGRPFYFSLLLVDPHDYEKIYKPGWSLSISVDGGKSFSGIGGVTHSDHHALWIDPDNPNFLLAGTDGGLYSSTMGGMQWNFLQALPISQFYRVSHDMADPYHVYGGLQDNGTWRAPSRAPRGIKNKNWDNIGWGDGFYAVVDRADADIVYVESQGGNIVRTRLSTGESKNIQPLPARGDPEYRFNWNTPIYLSPNRDDTLYIGGQFLFRSRDRGESWEKLSPDLTTNDPQKQRQMDSGGLTIDNSTAENHCTIYTICESPFNEKLIWAGTDDGNLELTRDGGRTWTNLIENVPDLPACTWVSFIEAGRHNESTAYVTFDGHRTGDMKPYVYKTTDFGESWVSLATEDIEGYCHVIRQDLVNADLLFVGTEFGLYVSLDGGRQWARFKEGVPKVSVQDLAIHPRDHDLILATHGRGILIVDDITPLRHLTAGVLESDAALLPTRPSIMRIPARIQEFAGDDEFVGDNPSSSARIAYYLKKRHLFGDLKLEIYNLEGQLVSTVPAAPRRGINVVEWHMREKAPKVPPAPGLGSGGASIGPQVAEGDYTVKLVQNKNEYQGTISLVMDPRADYTPEDRAVQDKTVMQLYHMLERLSYVVEAVEDLRDQVQKQTTGLDPEDAVASALAEFAEDLDAFRKTLIATRKGGALAGEEQLREKITRLYGAVNNFEGRPTTSQITYAGVLDERLRQAETDLQSHVARIEQLNRALEAAGAEPLKVMTKEEWKAKQEQN